MSRISQLASWKEQSYCFLQNPSCHSHWVKQKLTNINVYHTTAESRVRTDYSVLLIHEGSSPEAWPPLLPVSAAPCLVGWKQQWPWSDLPHWNAPPDCASVHRLPNEGMQAVGITWCILHMTTARNVTHMLCTSLLYWKDTYQYHHTEFQDPTLLAPLLFPPHHSAQLPCCYCW